MGLASRRSLEKAGISTREISDTELHERVNAWLWRESRKRLEGR